MDITTTQGTVTRRPANAPRVDAVSQRQAAAAAARDAEYDARRAAAQAEVFPPQGAKPAVPVRPMPPVPMPAPAPETAETGEAALREALDAKVEAHGIGSAIPAVTATKSLHWDAPVSGLESFADPAPVTPPPRYGQTPDPCLVCGCRHPARFPDGAEMVVLDCDADGGDWLFGIPSCLCIAEDYHPDVTT
jgi:hypothetical protein